MLKILCVYDNSIGVGSLFKALRLVPPDQATVQTIKLSEYETFDDSEFDCLIYNTFPDTSHPAKFRKELIEKTDKKFILFPGKALLFDSHSETDIDAYVRFDIKFPRVKTKQSFFELLNEIMAFFSMSDDLEIEAGPETQLPDISIPKASRPKLLSKIEVDAKLKAQGFNREQRRQWFKENKPAKKEKK